MSLTGLTFSKFTTKEEHDRIALWWESQRWPTVALSHLPPVGWGVRRDGTLVCACWLYLTGTVFCHLEWVVADPKLRRQERTDALNMMIEGTLGAARAAGCESVFTSTRHATLISRLERQGFQQTDKNMTNLIARV